MDYTSLSELVTFPASTTTAVQCRSVTLLDDNVVEDDETFQVQIRDSVCQLNQIEAIITIVDNGNFFNSTAAM